MRLFALAALALLIAVANALNITGPTETDYWVQNQTNKVITWTFNEGDPATFNIEIGNTANTTLNGNFSIATAVNATTQFIALTNVTLRVADGYFVQFVNGTNTTQIYAIGQTFSVKAPGTADAPTATSASTTSGTTSGTAATSPSSSTSSSNATGANGNGAMSVGTNQGIFGLLAACGVASITALLL